MKRKYALAMAATLPFMALSVAVNAQTDKQKHKDHEKAEVLSVSENDSTTIKETLSGINLQPVQKGAFQLDFQQELKEDARLEIKNKAGKLVYHAPVNNTDEQQAWKFNVGKLKPDTYLVEVKTSDTTYWTKFKIGR